ncbi:DJ-1/PfpI family protein [Streptoalloteichus hindustanus]|uniref:Transcriptional regulator, AraC family with amidase-like domain n=1 Tax=Streptoalloteichus hindustanus TaxID=2017 RepID=A0A1M5JFS5_STRHI|nr:helix-turn-helix domain-containing protein [Streptoalloteichus hindustanus]SHG39446.1 transcriptional regulator, AraC family with amidase-like domain [Streptoalloteichus hindustanus]
MSGPRRAPQEERATATPGTGGTRDQAAPAPHRVVALALPDVVAFDLSVAAQVFGHRREDFYAFEVCTPDPPQVPTTTGFALAVSAGLDALVRADTVVVPGYTRRDEIPPAALAALRSAHARGARVVSICTGAFALAAAGLLDGRQATTHWMDADELARRHPAVSVVDNVLYVDDGDVATSAGVAAGIDLCLHLVRSDFGQRAATGIARRLVFAPFRAGSQAQYLERPVPERGRGAGDEEAGLGATRRWAQERLTEPLTLRDLAGHAGYSVRSFSRRFLAETGTPPLRWLHDQRVALALRLLEETDLPVDRVAEQSGLGTAANLRLHLRRAVGATPTAHRRDFRGDDRNNRRNDRNDLGGPDSDDIRTALGADGNGQKTVGAVGVDLPLPPPRRA